MAAAIAEYLEILGSRERILGIVRQELIDVKALFAVPRRTAILDSAELRISQIRVDSPRMREQPAIYAVESFAARRILLGEDDDLNDLLDDDDE